jgi:hypothetical protein
MKTSEVDTFRQCHEERDTIEHEKDLETQAYTPLVASLTFVTLYLK